MDLTRALKAALLMSRVLICHMQGEDFNLHENGVNVSAAGTYLFYEDVPLRLVDMFQGAMLLLRGMIVDLAELQDSHPAEVARMLELATAMNEAVGQVELTEMGPVE